MRDGVVIEALATSEFAPFVAYLNAHLAENGTGERGYFQPVPRDASLLSSGKVEALRSGLCTPVPELGWRRVWVARRDGAWLGHVDLRARPEPFTAHRCLLGMGVDRASRGRGLGTRLLAVATGWAAATGSLDWIDLEVISSNVAAIRLYEKAGFALAGELSDLFRVDGVALGSRTMTKRLPAPTD